MPEPAPGRHAVPTLPRVAVIAATAAAVALAHGADAFWICIPSALLISAWSRTLEGAAIGSAAAIAAAAIPVVGSDTARAPSPPLAILIPAASVAILLITRQRVERERNAIRTTALTDPLTGVANRRSLLSRVDYEIARHTRSRTTFALIMLDLVSRFRNSRAFEAPLAAPARACGTLGILPRLIGPQPESSGCPRRLAQRCCASAPASAPAIRQWHLSVPTNPWLGTLIVVCYRFAAYATPLRTVPAWQPARFSRGDEDDPTQYLSLHPLGPLAELMRNAELRSPEQLRAISTRTWALEVPIDDLPEITFGTAERFGVTPHQLVGDDYGPCQELAGRLRVQVQGLIVPSAALPGTRNVVLFGARVAAPYLTRPVSTLDVPASITADGARPPRSLRSLVRFGGDTHAALDAWRNGIDFRFAEPDWSL